MDIHFHALKLNSRRLRGRERFGIQTKSAAAEERCGLRRVAARRSLFAILDHSSVRRRGIGLRCCCTRVTTVIDILLILALPAIGPPSATRKRRRYGDGVPGRRFRSAPPEGA